MHFACHPTMKFYLSMKSSLSEVTFANMLHRLNIEKPSRQLFQNQRMDFEKKKKKNCMCPIMSGSENNCFTRNPYVSAFIKTRFKV